MQQKNIFYFLLLFCFGWFQPGVAQQVAEGIVYHDKNENQQLDDGEEGIPDVAVSNGREVVLTNERGHYELPVEENTTIFVIKPAQYRLPRNEDNLPQFYYIHKPEGSPDLKYDAVAPTGPLPESINFGLLPGDASASFDILVFGDPQPYSVQEVKYFDEDIISPLAKAQKYQFGITLGDIVGDDLDLYPPYVRSISRVGIPWFNVMGNHDVNYDAKTDAMADETFESVFGPPTYSFNEGKVHFIILDDIVYPRTDGEDGYIGGLTPKQLAFIENDLELVPKDHLVVVAFHIPVWAERHEGSYRLADQKQFFALLDDFENSLSLSAHTHYQRVNFFEKGEETWQGENPHVHYNVGTTSGDWWSGWFNEEDVPITTMRDGTPNGYAVLHFDGNQYTFDYFAAGFDKDFKMRVTGPETISQNTDDGAFYVNYFLGNKKTKVEYQLPNGEWKAMKKVEEGDPHLKSILAEWDSAEKTFEGDRPSDPIPSSHLWKAPVPTDIAEGDYTLDVRVTDYFGRTFSDSFSYEVVTED